MFTCKRHPDKPAKRRCYQCKDYICPTCQHTLDNHVFCSHACHLAWKAHARRAKIRKSITNFLNAFNPLIWWRYPAFRRVDWAKRSMLTIWLLLLSNLAMVAGLYSLHHSVQVLKAENNNLVSLEAPSLTSAWIQEPQDSDGIVTMRVAAPDTDTLVLKNGAPVAEVAAGTATTITLKSTTTAPANWTLVAKSDARGEKWTLASTNPKDLRRAKRPGIALTFDGGAARNAVDDILQTLQLQSVRATFFLTGEFIRRFPDTTRKILRHGHEIGNHTWSHPHLTTFDTNFRHDTRPDIDEAWFQNQLLRTTHIFARITGEMMAPYWRAPYGETNDEINRWATDLGFQHIGWTSRGSRAQTLDTLDWVYDPKDPLYVSGKAMAQQVVTLSKRPEFSGGIVLMHVGTQRKSEQVHKQLPNMIAGISKAGIPLLTVSELAKPADG